MNRVWHATHRLSKGSTLDERVRWHTAHARVCGCRPMPATVVAELKRRGRRDGVVAKTSGVTVRRVQRPTSRELDGLVDVLVDCVEGGASVSFMLPLTRTHALAFWRQVAEGVRAGDRALVIAEDAEGICGTVQLVLAQPDNQPHRADLSKMLVHRRGRRKGVGAALMTAAETIAREAGKTLLVLDTASADAERLYERMGWVRVGVIPGYALLPDGGLCDTTYFYRQLGG